MHRFKDICDGHYFMIPENQRGFSWERRQVEDMINDLILAATHTHYMGPLIVSRTQTPDFQDDDLTTTVEFTLEDGQQRLTTLFIMANEIKRQLEALPGQPDLEARSIEGLLFYNKNGRQLRLRNRN